MRSFVRVAVALLAVTPAVAVADARHFHPYGPVWVAPAGAPVDVFIAGQEPRRVLPLCRGRYNDGVHIGKVVDGRCHIGWGGSEVNLEQYELATQVRHATWIAGRDGGVPAGAFPLGFEPGHPLFACRAPYGGGVHPGKIVGRNCNFGWGGKEVTSPSYEVLVIPQWVLYAGAIPSGAFQAGGEPARPLYACAGWYHDGFHPGKVVDTTCNIGWGGDEVHLTEFYVLTGIYRARWVPVRGAVPPNALLGGQERERLLPFCRAVYQGTQPGKVVDGKCNFGYGGKELRGDVFEVLLANDREP